MQSELFSRRYLDRSLEDWFGAYLQSPCPARSQYLEALTSFGQPFARLAADAVAGLDAKKQLELVWITSFTDRDGLSTLLRWLKHPSADIRAAACRWWRYDMGENPSDKSQVFAKFLSDFGSRSREDRKESLSRLYNEMDSALTLIESKTVVPESIVLALVDNLGHPDPRVRCTAFEQLETIRINDPALKETVSNALQATQIDSNKQQERDIPWLGCDNAFPVLDAPLETWFQKVKSPLASDRVFALESIARLRVDERFSGEEILPELKDPDMAVRIAAARTLGSIHCGNLKVAWGLQAALTDPCLLVAESAESSLRCVIVQMACFLDAI